MIPDEIQPYLRRLSDLVGQNILGIVVYGSALSSVTKSSSSTPDFFVVVDSYFDFYRATSHAVLNSFLPPNIYHFTANQKHSKYCVVSLSRLQREVRIPSDMYLVGRFSKKMAVGVEKKAGFSAVLSELQNEAMLTVAKKTLPLMPDKFSLEEFILKALSLSYLGDVRVEAGDKIQKLFDADPEFYRENYTKALSQLACTAVEPGKYEQDFNSLAKGIDKFLVEVFLLISRFRAQLRWPKSMFTASDWLDYIIQKIERTQGIKIDLTPTQKKLWFIYGWKYFLLLKKKNLIK